MRSRALRTLLAILAAVSLTACGAERPEPPSIDKSFEPNGFKLTTLGGGVARVKRPGNWFYTVPGAPGLMTIATGGASLTIWSYPPAEGVTTDADLKDAGGRIVKSLRGREPTFELESVRPGRVAGAPSVEVRGASEIAGEIVRVRSVHIYLFGAEYVVDAFARPDVFESVDESVFDPVIASLTIGSGGSVDEFGGTDTATGAPGDEAGGAGAGAPPAGAPDARAPDGDSASGATPGF